MSKSNTFENELLKLIFQNTDLANVGDVAGLRGSATAGSLYLSLHTAEVGEGGTQDTNECNYTGYARVAVARDTGGWTVSGAQVQNAALISFPACTGGANTITHFAVGKGSSGATVVLYKGALSTSVQGPFTAATNGTITLPGHSLSVDDRVAFYPLAGAALPTDMTEGTLYWVKTIATDTITIAATQGGTALTFSAVGGGVAYKAATLSVSTGITPQFAAGALVITED